MSGVAYEIVDSYETARRIARRLAPISVMSEEQLLAALLEPLQFAAPSDPEGDDAPTLVEVSVGWLSSSDVESVA